MGSSRVVCASPTFGMTAPEAVAQIEAAGADLVRPPADDGDLADARDVLADAVAIIVGTQQVDASVFDAVPNLRLVSKHGAGVDNIDVDAATRAGVVVSSAPGANATAVAELTLGLVLGLARGIVHQDRRVRQGRWGVAIGRALEEATLGIVGLGRIGRLLAVRAAACEMRVLGYDVVTPTGAVDEPPWEQVDLETVLGEADFVTLHVPLTPDTEHLIDDDALRRMKPSAYLVNAARGGVVDEKALDRALSEGRIAGAALDVFRDEPIGPDHPLVRHEDRTILTPHMGAYTDRALARTSAATARDVVAALQGRWPPGALNEPDPWRGASLDDLSWSDLPAGNGGRDRT